jgi:hypothetical protein
MTSIPAITWKGRGLCDRVAIMDASASSPAAAAGRATHDAGGLEVEVDGDA